jgi:hypothetical protein
VKKHINICLFVILLFAFDNARANPIKKAFLALDQKNYGLAFSQFQKLKKRNPSLAYFGLTQIYQSPALYNLDSCLKYALKAENTLNLVSSKQFLDWKKYGFDSTSIVQKKFLLSTNYFVLLQNDTSIVNYNNFITQQPWAKELSTAIDVRDSLVFNAVLKLSNLDALQSYMNTYPESKMYNKTLAVFNELQYNQSTSDGLMDSYISFIEMAPNNPFKGQAEDHLYALLTQNNMIKELDDFVHKYPENRNYLQAWKRLYQLFMKDYSSMRLEQFRAEYSDYPFLKQLQDDIALFNENLYPFKEKDLYGFINNKGEVIIPASYSEVSDFSEGLAVVSDGLKMGLIDKKNSIIIPFVYDEISNFLKGRAIVTQNNWNGIIDRTGVFIFPPEFNDIGYFKNDLYYTEKEGAISIYDLNFHQMSCPIMEQITPLVSGKFKVLIDGKVSFLNDDLTLSLPLEFDDILPFSDSVYCYQLEGKFGLLQMQNKWKTPNVYDEIYPLSEGIAMVRIKDKFGYINTEGKLILPCNFNSFENCARVSQHQKNQIIVHLMDKFLIIDPSGKTLLNLPYEMIGEPGEWIPVLKNYKWGFVNWKGKEMTGFDFDLVEKLDNNYFIVERAGQVGLVRIQNNNFVFNIPLAYLSIAKLDSELLLVKNIDGFGLTNYFGEILVPNQYLQIQKYGDGVLKLFTPTELVYYFTRNSFILKHK